jgi:prepilin-type processing-associated H-X9-DG protein
LPPAYTPNYTGTQKAGPCSASKTLQNATSNGLQKHYILTFILPYLENQPLFDQIDFSKPWTNGVPGATKPNIRVVQVDIPDYICPSAPSRANKYAADYLALVDVLNTDQQVPTTPPKTNIGYCTLEQAGLKLQPRTLERLDGMITDAAIPIRKVTDGVSKTFMFFECGGRPNHFERGVDKGESNSMHYQWADHEAYGVWGPGDECGLSTVMNCENFDEIYSFHPGGAIFLFGDGSADFLSENIDLDSFISLFTRAAEDVAAAK